MKESLKKISKLLLNRYIILIGIGAISGLMMLHYLSYGEEYLLLQAQNQVGFAVLGSVILICFDLISHKLDKILSWQHFTGSRMLAGIVICSLLITGTAMLMFNFFPSTFKSDIQSIELTPAAPLSSDQDDNELLTKVSILAVIFSLIHTIIYFARYSYKQFAITQVETIKQERKQIDLQLKALKSQLGPHFLFNSLNAVSSLIYKKEEDAEKFVRKLGHNYQYLMKSHQQTLVTLQNELEFAVSYHHLLKTRMGDQVQLSYNLSSEVLSSKIPPVTLQMLIENAVKHNQINKEDILTISIKNEKDYLLVKNNITTKNQKVTSHQIGLKNINARYKLLIGKEIDVHENDHFTVKLPIIR